MRVMIPAAVPALLLVLGVTCASRPVHPPLPLTTGTEITFNIREAGRLPLRDLSGVEVIAIGANGTSTSLGRSFGGTFRVAKERLRSLSPQAVLFCVEGFHCGAIRIQPSWDLFAYDEYPIDLAPVVLY
jgi:hypothetical protein